MPQPTMSEVHVDGLLTNISVAYMQEATNFIADKVFPVVPVQKQSDKFRTYTKADFLRSDAKRLGPGSMAHESGFGVSSGTYSCDVWALAAMVDEQTAANYDEPGSAEEDHAANLMQDLLIQREVQWAADFFATSKWGTDETVAAGDKWDVSTSDPKKSINGAKETILAATGFEPNTLVMSYYAFTALTEHPLVRDQFKYTSADSINEALLARFFGVDRVFITKAVQNSGVEGGTASYGFIAGKHALLVYSAPVPRLMTPSGGYTFTWSGLTGMNNVGIRTMRYDVPERHGVKIEVNASWDMKVVASDVGYFFSGVVS